MSQDDLVFFTLLAFASCIGLLMLYRVAEDWWLTRRRNHELAVRERTFRSF